MRYKVENVKISEAMPAQTRGMEAMQIVAYMRDHYKTDITSEYGEVPKNKATRMMQATADAIFDPNNWKNPIYVTFPRDANGHDATEWVKATIVWYHGARPLASFIGVYSQGYAC